MSDYEKQQEQIDANDWIEVRTIEREEEVGLLQKELDDGEAEAIVLAKEVNAHFLIVDERKGRLVAQSHGIRVIGLLGVLLQAKKVGQIVMLEPILDQLIHEAGFRVRRDLYIRVLSEAGEL